MNEEEELHGWIVSSLAYDIIYGIRVALGSLIFFTPVVSLFFYFLLPLCCCVCLCRKLKCCKAVNNLLMSITEYFFWYLKKEKSPEKGLRFKVWGLTAPPSYTYFLLFVFLLMFIHCASSFCIGSLLLHEVDLFDHSSVRECTEANNDSLCVYYRTVNIFQLDLVEGLEKATFTLATSTFAFAMVSILLVKCSGGRRNDGMSCICRGADCCKKTVIIFIQIVFTVLPRTLTTVYFFAYSTHYSPKDEESILLPTPSREGEVNSTSETRFWWDFANLRGVLDSGSYFLILAICDSISLAMLTPWYLFKREKNGTPTNDSKMQMASRC